MTYIPTDTKDPRGPGASAPVPTPGFGDHPPPYSPTDPSISGSQYGDSSHSRSTSTQGYMPLPHPSLNPTPATTRPSSPLPSDIKIPESNAVKSNSVVKLSGPLHILGNVDAASNIMLQEGIIVDGKTDSSGGTSIRRRCVVKEKVKSSGGVKLYEDVRVEKDVRASGSIECYDGVTVLGKVEASGSIELRDGVTVGDKVDASGSVTLNGRVRVEGKVASSGNTYLRNGVWIGGDVNASNKIKVEGKGLTTIVGDVKASNALSVDEGCDLIAEKDVTIKRCGMEIKGRMHIKGDLDVKGTVTVAKGAELRIDGKRTLHGKLEGEITYGFAQQQQSFAGKELRSMT